MALTGKLGLLLTATGAAHFAAPALFEDVTKAVFPKDTADWVKRNGASETAIGLAMMLPKTRRLGVLGLLGYTGWLGYNYNAVSGGAVVEAAKAAADTAKETAASASDGASAASAPGEPAAEPAAEPLPDTTDGPAPTDVGNA